MPAGDYDISSEQGTTFNLSLTYQDSASSAIDLESYTGRMQVRRSVKDTKALLFLTGTTGSSVNTGSLTGGGSTGDFTTGSTAGQTGTGGIQLNTSSTGGTGHTGGIYISVDSSTMSNVPVGKFFYDLELVTGTTVSKVIKGRFTNDGEITR